jgi:hypothetical protein
VAPARQAPAAREPLSRGNANRAAALGGLLALGVIYVALAALFAAPGSNVVLATAGGSPDWLLGPLRVLGLDAADGPLAGPLFYLGLWLALAAYVVVLINASAIAARLAIAAIVAVQVLFLFAPPLLSQDVFSYLAYARLDVLHGLNPYNHTPNDFLADAVYPFAGSKDATSAYGPLFTLSTYPLAKLGVTLAYWVLKIVTAAASLGIVAATWKCARVLGRDPVPPALFVALNPLVAVHVVAAAHNDALMMAVVMAGVLTLLHRRAALAGGLSALGVGIKASAVVVAPFMLAGALRRWSLVFGALIGGTLSLGVSLLAFGDKAFGAFLLIGQNQDKTSMWSVPQRLADGIGALTGGDPDSIVRYTRALFASALVIVVAALLRSAWRNRERCGYWIAMAGWATLAVLLATAWLVPWYAIWLLPLAALSADRRLIAASIALCAYLLVIAVPL